MVHTYGVTPATNADPGTHEAGEHSTLLAVSSSSPVQDRDGHATLMSCISNLANTIIGSGMLTFPLAMASGGLVPGMFTCVLSGCVSAFALYLLTLCATHAPHRRASFFAIAKMTFPSAAVFFDASVAIKCFGVSISYLIIIKGLTPHVVESLYHVVAPSIPPPPWTLNGKNWLILFSTLLVPLCYLRRLDSLRHASYSSLFAVSYLAVIVIKCYFWPMEGMPSRGDVYWVHLTPGFVATFPVQVFAYTCAQNIFPLYNEVKRNTQKRMNIIIGASIGSAMLAYEIVAIIGYLTFGSNVGANIIAMYPSTSLFIAVGQIAIVVLVIASYPLQVHPCRNCFDKVFSFNRREEYKPIPEGNEDEDEIETNVDHSHAEMSPSKHFLLTSAIVISTFSIAYFVDDLSMVLSFVGSTGSTVVSFILPGLLYWKLTRDDASKSRTLNKAAVGLVVYGVLVFVFCLGFNVYQVVSKASGKLHGDFLRG